MLSLYADFPEEFDTGTPLLANDAVILAEGPEGKREIPIREFFIFVRKTALKKDEIVTAIRVPYHAGSEGVYTKISRRREVDLSTVCATVVRDGDDWRIAFGSADRAGGRAGQDRGRADRRRARLQGVPRHHRGADRQEKPRSPGEIRRGYI